MSRPMKYFHEHDAMLLAGGAGWPRDLKVPGRELLGIHFAMEYLTQQNRICEGDLVSADEVIWAADKHVVIIGGGDTGADWPGNGPSAGSSGRSPSSSSFPQPPDERAEDNPWPLWPNIFRVSPAHKEGGDRLFAASTQRFSGNADQRVNALHATQVEMAS